MTRSKEHWTKLAVVSIPGAKFEVTRRPSNTVVSVGHLNGVKFVIRAINCKPEGAVPLENKLGLLSLSNLLVTPTGEVNLTHSNGANIAVLPKGHISNLTPFNDQITLVSQDHINVLKAIHKALEQHAP